MCAQFTKLGSNHKNHRDGRPAKRRLPGIVQTPEHPYLQGDDLEWRGELAPSLSKAIMELTFSN